MKNYIFFGSLVCAMFLTGCEEGEGNSVVHQQGKDCRECHAFGSSGTIYSTLKAQSNTDKNTAKDYRVQLLLDTNQKIILKQTRGYGNVRWSGDVGAINSFTAQVIDANGNVVNSSLKNSHNVGRLSCNSCHTSQGLSGAPGRIVNYNYYKTLSAFIVQ
jgi:cytochrome c5